MSKTDKDEMLAPLDEQIFNGIVPPKWQNKSLDYSLADIKRIQEEMLDMLCVPSSLLKDHNAKRQ